VRPLHFAGQLLLQLQDMRLWVKDRARGCSSKAAKRAEVVPVANARFIAFICVFL